jgi:hypothetical protein
MSGFERTVTRSRMPLRQTHPSGWPARHWRKTRFAARAPSRHASRIEVLQGMVRHGSSAGGRSAR